MTVINGDTGIDRVQNNTVGFADLLGTEWENNKATNGYTKLPNGIILQWGYQARGTVGEVTVTFPTAFPAACVSITTNKANTSSTTGLGMESYDVDAVGVTSFQYSRYTDADLYWFAVGY